MVMGGAAIAVQFLVENWDTSSADGVSEKSYITDEIPRNSRSSNTRRQLRG